MRAVMFLLIVSMIQANPKIRGYHTILLSTA